MRGFLVALLTCSVSMSALALFYMAMTPLLEKRYSEKGRYYAWLIIVIGLIIPFRPQFSHAIVKLDMPGEMAPPVIQIGNAAPVAIPVDVNPTRPPAPSHLSIWQVAAVVWLMGMIVFLACHIIKHYRFVKMAARWSNSITDKQVPALLQSLKAEMGISKEIGLYLCLSIGSPMMIGFANPCILLPTADLTHDQLRFILKHELIHYKRKDLYYKCLVLVATAIHWFNPVVYLVAKTIGHQCELSCDAETMRGTDGDARRQYSETILGVAKRQTKQKTALSTDFYGGKKGMKKRISSILDTRNKRLGVAILCGALFLTLGTTLAFASNTGATHAETDAGNYSAGDTVIIQVTADSVSDMIAYELELYYDKSALNLKGTRSSIEGIDQVFYVPEGDDYVVVSTMMSSGYNTFYGENAPICEFVMEVLRDGPIEDISVENFYYVVNSEEFDSPGKTVDATPGSGFNILSDFSEDPELDMFTMNYVETETKPKLYAESPIDQEPGIAGIYAGQLRLTADKQDISPGESCRVDVALNAPSPYTSATLICWFDPDELTYQGFDVGEREDMYIFMETVDVNSGIVRISMSNLERGVPVQSDNLGSFHFLASENARQSPHQSSLFIAADYADYTAVTLETIENDENYMYSQSGDITLSIK